MKRRTCLREGLVLYHFLRLAGYPAMMHFGVYHPEEANRRMQAHCWVTLAGQAVSEPPEGLHAVMLTYGQDHQRKSSL